MCEDCKGRGRWQEVDYSSDELVMVWKFCDTCNGTGKESIDDDFFDIPSNDEEV